MRQTAESTTEEGPKVNQPNPTQEHRDPGGKFYLNEDRSEGVNIYSDQFARLVRGQHALEYVPWNAMSIHICIRNFFLSRLEYQGGDIDIVAHEGQSKEFYTSLSQTSHHPGVDGR
jgi:hypothetical protein